MPGLPLKKLRDWKRGITNEDVAAWIEMVIAGREIVRFTVANGSLETMWATIELWEYGWFEKYCDDSEFRRLFHLWSDLGGYAELELGEYLEKCGMSQTDLAAAQTVISRFIIPPGGENSSV